MAFETKCCFDWASPRWDVTEEPSAAQQMAEEHGVSAQQKVGTRCLSWGDLDHRLLINQKEPHGHGHISGMEKR